MLTEKGNQSLLYASVGDRQKSEAMGRQFTSDSQAMLNELRTVLSALSSDPQVYKSLIAPLAAKTEAAIFRGD